ncbi:MAG TPA: amidohydrolase [Solirubrobacteraceae bacterium]|nr:amidohydrolase [Solirubrobacteraceae bacterium]
MPGSTEPDGRLLARLLEAIEAELPRAVELRHELHAEPELAHRETRTSATITAELPVPPRAVAGTGLLAQIGPEESAGAVAVRAELDGLPLRERTGAPYSATGEAMHACGHDVHMAALVALARAAHTLGRELPTPLLALFQPSEEAYPSGAEQLAAELASEPPAALVAAHVHPEVAWDAVALDTGAVNASCDAFTITLTGEPTHGAYPHRGSDTVLALAEVVTALHARAGRRIDPLAPASLTVGVLEAGSAENVVPASARARGALRAHRVADRELLRALVREVAAGVAAAHGVGAEVRIDEGEPALENAPAIVASGRELLELAGFRHAEPWRSCGSDDFAFLGSLGPLAMAFVGLRGAPGFQQRPLHHPELLVPDAAVGAVARTLACLYLAASASGDE